MHIYLLFSTSSMKIKMNCGNVCTCIILNDCSKFLLLYFCIKKIKNSQKKRKQKSGTKLVIKLVFKLNKISS